MNETENIKERIEASQDAWYLYEYAVSEAVGKSSVWVERFWRAFRDYVLEEAPIPKQEATSIAPMGDADAIRFGESSFPFGRYKDSPVLQVITTDPDYCRWLADDADNFALNLKRYLARDKYSDE